MTAGFVNLHNHSEYSLLDGYAHIGEYVRHAHEMGQPAIGLTDHGNLYGVHEFIKTCRDLMKTFNNKGKAQDPLFMKPIPGIEAYMAPLNPDGARVQTPVYYGRPEQHDNDVSARGTYLHLTLWAYNSVGFHNLIRLSSESFKPENMMSKYPRMDMDMLEEYNEGLIATTGCPSGEVPTRFRLGQDDAAYEYAERMKDIFDGRYFVEIMQHNMKRPLERELLPKLMKLAEDLDLPLLATNDSHYSYPDDAKHQEEMLAIGTKNSMSEPLKEDGGKRFAFDGNDYYLKSEDEMRRLFPDDEYPGAVDNTVRIAMMVDDWWASDDVLNEQDGSKIARIGDGSTIPSLAIDSPCTTVEKADKGWELGVMDDNGVLSDYDGPLFKGLGTILRERAENKSSLTGFPLPDKAFVLDTEHVSGDMQNAINADKVAAGPFDLSLDTKLRPVVEIPEGYTEETWFQKKINDGFIAKRLNAGDSKEVLEESKRKIALEYPVFANNNFIQYMLVVQDYIEWAKNQGIVVGAGRGCFLPGNRVTMADGSHRTIETIEPGDMVLTHDGSAREVIETYQYDVDHDDCVELTLENNSIITCTADHLVYERDRGYVKAGDLRKNDIVLTPWNGDETPLSQEPPAISTEPHVGTYASHVNDTIIPYVNDVELALMNRYETDTDIISYERNNHVIEYTTDDGTETRAHIPTFIVRKHADAAHTVDAVDSAHTVHTVDTVDSAHTADSAHTVDTVDNANSVRTLVVDVIPSDSHGDYDMVCAMMATRDWCNDEGYEYVVVDEHDIAWGISSRHGYVRVEGVSGMRYTGPVYDLHVRDALNYTVGGVTVHNSVGGSEIAYLMNISDTDPIRHDLLFERFLNPERVSPPDVDTDFQSSRRDEVLDYVKQKYGDDKIKNIIAISKEKAARSIKDMASIYDIKPFDANIATGKLPKTAQGEEIHIKDLLDPSSKLYADSIDFREYTFGSSDEVRAKKWLKVLQSAMAIEGRVRGVTSHACGVIMSDEAISEHVPTANKTLKKEEKENPDYKESWGETFVQWGYEACESMGLIKMDFLALKNIDIIGDTIDNILRMHGASESDLSGANRMRTIRRLRDNGIEIPDMSAINHGPMDDRETYEMLGRGESVGVFQLSSKGIRELLRRMQPKVFEDLSASIALYRPGPMAMNAHLDYADRASGAQERYVLNKNLDKEFRGTAVEAVTQPTYGLILYQEEIMQISQKLAGFTKGQSDALRKAIGHKKIEVMQQMEGAFKKGAMDNGISQEAVNELWDIIVAFASYAFNKSHSAAYALTSYDTAYLKCHYTPEFMAALLSGAIGKKDKIHELLEECSNINLTVGNVDVNRSGVYVSPVRKSDPSDPDIVFGLSCVEGVTPPIATKIVDAREAHGGRFKDFYDFMENLPEEALNKTVIENLAKAGAFDCFHVPRRAVAVSVDKIVNHYKKVRRDKDKGQTSLFDLMGGGDAQGSPVAFKLPDIQDWSFLENLGHERELMGMRVSANPLQNAGAGLQALKNESITSTDMLDTSTVMTTIADFRAMEPGARQYHVIGWFDSVDERKTRKGARWLNATIADETGTLQTSMYSGKYENILLTNPAPKVDHVYMFTLTMNRSYKDETKQAVLTNFREIELTNDGRIPMWVHLTHNENHAEERVQAIRELTCNHPGDLPIIVDWGTNDDGTQDTEEIGYIEWNADRLMDLEHIVGRKAFGQWNE